MRGERRRRYPWGGEYHHGLANAGRSGARVTESRDGYEMLAPARAFFDGRTKEGVVQLSGNAAEWTSTPYVAHGQTGSGTASSTFVVKGGSFMAAPVYLRGAARRALSGGTRSPDVGFRCARDLFPDKL
jgi:formylglycine-generating enzyme required for sulfatase activity